MKQILILLFSLAVALAAADIPQPKIVEKSAPDYTQEALLARLEGNVGVTVVVDTDSTLRDVHLSRPIGMGLDENALQIVKQWQFAPAKRDGQPIEAVAKVDVNFRMLRARTDWHLSRAEFDIPAGAARPVLVSAEYPATSLAAAPSTIRVGFDVDDQGVPVNLQVLQSNDPGDNDEVLNFLRTWRFQPGSAQGKPVTVPCTFEFARDGASNVGS